MTRRVRRKAEVLQLIFQLRPDSVRILAGVPLCRGQRGLRSRLHEPMLARILFVTLTNFFVTWAPFFDPKL